jgi:cytochrome c oxidase assembly protein subunit 15
LTWPNAEHEVANANANFPERPVVGHKAWKEMVHRYLAGGLVVLVVLINILAWKSVSRWQGHRTLSLVILVLILFQAALGMWTVTLKLLPIVVMGHLMGGMATFALLLWLAFRTGIRGYYEPNLSIRTARPWIVFGLIILILQISLGGWTSANYSALACPDFPLCQGAVWPDADFLEGFTLQREIGVDYEGGVLDLPARTAIHFAHRLGAIVTFLTLAYLGLRLIRKTSLRRSGAVLLLLLSIQVSLGVMNIVLGLPLVNAAAHNGVAALLLAQMVWLLHRSTPRQS